MFAIVYTPGLLFKDSMETSKDHIDNLRLFEPWANGRASYDRVVFDDDRRTAEGCLSTSYRMTGSRVSDYRPSHIANLENMTGMARIACGLEAYRLDHGIYPEHLEEIESSFAGGLPRDAFTDRPYAFIRLGETRFRLIDWYLKGNSGDLFLAWPEAGGTNAWIGAALGVDQ
jgi:hypothetical protein